MVTLEIHLSCESDIKPAHKLIGRKPTGNPAVDSYLQVNELEYECIRMHGFMPYRISDKDFDKMYFHRYINRKNGRPNETIMNFIKRSSPFAL